jgi:hypothetical protein
MAFTRGATLTKLGRAPATIQIFILISEMLIFCKDKEKSTFSFAVSQKIYIFARIKPKM